MQKVPILLLALLAFALASAPACQAVFGDYKVDTGALEARICEVDEYRCSNEVLEVCALNRSHWEAFASCASANQCNLNSDSCRPCQAGVERQCSGATLLGCNASSQWEKLKDCSSPALCSVSAGDCLPPACPTPGAHTCLEDGTLQRCAADRSHWENIAKCASPADCDGPQADAQAMAGKPGTCKIACERGSGACAAPTCDTPGSLRCAQDISSLQRCSETFKWEFFAQCTNFALCNATLGLCEEPRCATEQRRCTGSTVEQCKDDRTGWAKVRDCPPGTLCDPNAAPGAECVPGPCTSGQTRCNSLFVEQCNGTSWERTKRCATNCNSATKDCPP